MICYNPHEHLYTSVCGKQLELQTASNTRPCYSDAEPPLPCRLRLSKLPAALQHKAPARRKKSLPLCLLLRIFFLHKCNINPVSLCSISFHSLSAGISALTLWRLQLPLSSKQVTYHMRWFHVRLNSRVPQPRLKKALPTSDYSSQIVSMRRVCRCCRLFCTDAEMSQ